MLNRPSFMKTLAIVTLVIGLALSISSCGTQKMGCPGSITQSEQSSDAQG